MQPSTVVEEIPCNHLHIQPTSIRMGTIALYDRYKRTGYLSNLIKPSYPSQPIGPSMRITP